MVIFPHRFLLSHGRALVLLKARFSVDAEVRGPEVCLRHLNILLISGSAFPLKYLPRVPE